MALDVWAKYHFYRLYLLINNAFNNLRFQPNATSTYAFSHIVQPIGKTARSNLRMCYSTSVTLVFNYPSYLSVVLLHGVTNNPVGLTRELSVGDWHCERSIGCAFRRKDGYCGFRFPKKPIIFSPPCRAPDNTLYIHQYKI